MTWHPDMPDEFKNQIVTGDARVLSERIPDESVDLVFTDPVYDRIDDYRWLAETAGRVLKPEGELLAYYGQYYFTETILALSKFLRVRWPLTEKKIGGSAYMWVYNLSNEVKPLLWCTKNGIRQGMHRIDFVYAKPEGRERNHKWHKGRGKVTKWMLHYSRPFDIVLDFFCGGGTIPAVCKMLGRHYIGFEIDPATAELARERVARTQPPLPKINELLQAELIL